MAGGEWFDGLIGLVSGVANLLVAIIVAGAAITIVFRVMDRLTKDIDETHELNYRYVMQEIARLGFTGFVSHEYSPKQGSDPLAVLKKAIEICDV